MVDQLLVESLPCFAPLPSETKAALANALEEVSADAGKSIVSQGDFAYELFAIIDGTARVEQNGETVATLGPGELCGEIGILLTGRRTAAIVADTPMRLLALFDQSFRRLAREYPDFAELVHGQSQGRFTRVS